MRTIFIGCFFLMSFDVICQQWHTMGTGLTRPSYPASAYSITSLNDSIIVSGVFKKANNVIVNSIAKWNGTNWLPFNNGIWFTSIPDSIGIVSKTVQYKGNMIAGGLFDGAGGNFFGDTTSKANCITKWNGTTWSPISPGPNLSGVNSTCSSLYVYNENLYVGGSFVWAFDSSGFVSSSGVVRWNDTTFSNVGNLDGDFPPNGDFAALAFTEYQGKLIMGGYFTSIDGSPLGSYSGIAAWNDTVWSALGSGFNDAVFALTVYNGTLYAGGKFTATADNLTPLNHIAKWNGTQWLPVGEGFNGDVYAICGDTLTNNLYAGGSFTQTGAGFPANHISRWNGSFWQELYYGTNNDVYALYAKDSNLYVGGKFTQVGTGTAASCIAVWGYQPVGIEEQDLNKNIQVFPNPSSGTFRVLLEPDQNKDPNTEIKVWNALGALIYAGKMQNNMVEISLSNSPKGIYFIQIQADKLFYTSKLVIE